MRTDLMNNREAEQAMQLDQLIVETMAVFAADADEILTRLRLRPTRCIVAAGTRID
jgi:hypothetical protein